MSKIISGIYKITNKENGKIYIGSSKNIERRWLEHKNLLNKNKHHSQHLQYSWNKYGENNFKFEVIYETDNLDMLLNLEQEFLDKYTPYDEDKGYNICSVAGQCPLTKESLSIQKKYKEMNTPRVKYNSFYIYKADNTGITNNIRNISSNIFYKFLIEIYFHVIVAQQKFNFNACLHIDLYNRNHYINIIDIASIEFSDYILLLNEYNPLAICISNFLNTSEVRIFGHQLNSYKFHRYIHPDGTGFEYTDTNGNEDDFILSLGSE